MNTKPALILSCEHAVNHIPNAYKELFAAHEDLLNTHRGIDFGALALATHLKQALEVPLVQAETSRLLIDCNRSLSNPNCFSEISKQLTSGQKKQIIEQYYFPFRQQLIHCIDENIAEGRQVIHLSVHSFTPVMNDFVRNTDLGFLYDPQRTLEKSITRQWKQQLHELAPEYRVRMNYPYKGTSDGFTTFLRQQYTPNDYLGIEIEVNQALTQDPKHLNSIKKLLTMNFLTLNP